MSEKKMSDEERIKRLREFGFKEVAINKEEQEKFRKDVSFLFSARQEVVFSSDAFRIMCGGDFPIPQLSLDDLHNLDVGLGISLGVLVKEIIEKYVPAIASWSTLTTKRIIDADYIRRVGGPCSLLVLIKVTFSGLINEECEKLTGLYLLRLDPADNGYKIRIGKHNIAEFVYEGVHIHS